MSRLDQWADAVSRELDIADAVGWEQARDLVLDLARTVAHGVERPAAPVTAFLLGVAAGRAAEPPAALADLAGRVLALVAGWADRQD